MYYFSTTKNFKVTRQHDEPKQTKYSTMEVTQTWLYCNELNHVENTQSTLVKRSFPKSHDLYLIPMGFLVRIAKVVVILMVTTPYQSVEVTRWIQALRSKSIKPKTAARWTDLYTKYDFSKTTNSEDTQFMGIPIPGGQQKNSKGNRNKIYWTKTFRKYTKSAAMYLIMLKWRKYQCGQPKLHEVWFC